MIRSREGEDKMMPVIPPMVKKRIKEDRYKEGVVVGRKRGGRRLIR